MIPGEISVSKLGFECILGALPFERETPQPIEISYSLTLDFSGAASKDDLSLTVDYAKLSEKIQDFVSGSKFQLLETLVVKTAQLILDEYPQVLEAEVCVTKPRAIPGAQGASASVRITR